MSFMNGLRSATRAAMKSKLAGHIKKFADGGTTPGASKPQRAFGGMVGDDMGPVDGASAARNMGRSARGRGRPKGSKGKAASKKGTTNVTVAVMPKPDAGPAMPPPMAGPPPGAMPPPMPGPGPDMGAPPMMPPPGAGPLPMHADGGKVVKMTAGAASGEGRLEKTEAAKKRPDDNDLGKAVA